MRPEEAEEMDAMDEKIGSLQCRLDRAQKERDSARARVAELVAALEAVACPGPYGRSVLDWERARAALAKAKGGTS